MDAFGALFGDVAPGGGAYSSESGGSDEEQEEERPPPHRFSELVQQPAFAAVVQMVPEGEQLRGLGAACHAHVPAYLTTKEHFLVELEIGEGEGEALTDKAKATKLAQVFDGISQVCARTWFDSGLNPFPISHFFHASRWWPWVGPDHDPQAARAMPICSFGDGPFPTGK